MDSFGERIRHIRGTQTRDQFAARLGVHKNTLANYERDDRSPDAAVLAQLAKDGFNSNWILTGEGSMRLEGRHAAAHADMVQGVLEGNEAAHERREARGQAVLEWSRDIQARIGNILDMPGLELSRGQREYLLGEIHELARTMAPVDTGSGTAATDFIEVPLYAVEASAGAGAAVTSEEIRGRYAFRADFIRAKGWRPDDLALITGRGDSMPGVIEDGQLVLINRGEREITSEGIYVLRLDEHLVIKAAQRDYKGNVHIRSTNPIYREMMVPREDLGELEVIGRAVWTDNLL